MMLGSSTDHSEQGASAIERASLWSKTTFSWVGPLIQKGADNEAFEDRDALFLVRQTDDVIYLSQQFSHTYENLAKKYKVGTAAPINAE
jgi:hypothetical protein